MKEENGSVLTDAALYDLLKGTSPIALSKGLSLKTGGEPLVASSQVIKSRQMAKPAPSPFVSSAPPKQEPGEQATVRVKRARVATSIKPGPRERRIEGFDKSISALLAYDFDGDGEKEIVVGFANQIALFKFNKDGVAKVWEKDFKSSEQITGFGAGDFNGNGKIEIYVNKVTASSKIKSLVLEVDGGSYRVLIDDQPILFYSGDDGKLYGQGQNKNRSLKFAARPKYTKSQVIVLEYSGATYTKRSETTIVKGAVHGFALIDDSAPGLILVARNYYSIFGKERSELILLDINQF